MPLSSRLISGEVGPDCRHAIGEPVGGTRRVVAIRRQLSFDVFFLVEAQEFAVGFCLPLDSDQYSMARVDLASFLCMAARCPSPEHA